MVNDWKVPRQYDCRPNLALLKDKGFLGMIIPKKYGGLEFSAYATRRCHEAIRQSAWQ